MTVVPGIDPQTLSLVCDTCGQAVDDIESAAEHWPVVWAVISRQGWGGSPLAIGPHHCPQCFGATGGVAIGAGGNGEGWFPRGDQEWGASLTDYPRACVVRLRGQLDILYAPELREVLLEAGNRHHNVVLDLSGVRLLDSTGLGQLVQAQQLAQRQGGRLCLVAPSAFVLTVLETMRLASQLDIFSETGDALHWLASIEPSRR